MEAQRQRLAAAVEAFEHNDWARARSAALLAAMHDPREALSRYIAGVSALQMGRLMEALHDLRRAAALAPQRLDVLSQYARALTMAQDLPEAVAVAHAAMPLTIAADADPVACDTLATVYTNANLHDLAAQASRRAVELAPLNASYRFNLATSLMFEGDFPGAESECERCLALAPDFWRAYLSLSQLRRQTSESNHIEDLTRLASEHMGNADAQLHLNLALAKELEDLGRYDAAFCHYSQGKAAHRQRIKYEPRRDQARFGAIMRCFDALGRKGAHAAGDPSDAPIFIIGMPRSGTTLVDRILAAHSQVHSAGELGSFEASLNRSSGRPMPSRLEFFELLATQTIDWGALGWRYIQHSQPNAGVARHFTDKLPHNFLFLGFIARALPNAKIILVRRNPLDTCLGNFRQLFATDLHRFDYSYDLLETGRYFLAFDQLMKYWRQVLGERIIEVAYEDLICAQEDATRRLLSACGLEWEDAVLRPELGSARVATASAVQVRDPVNRASLYRWRHFESQLEELRNLLERAGLALD